MKMDGAKEDSGDSGEEGEGVVLTFQMDDFHPHEFYILYDWGPTVRGVWVCQLPEEQGGHAGISQEWCHQGQVSREEAPK